MGDNKKREGIKIYPSEDLILEELRELRSIQESNFDSLDKKIVTLLSVNGIIFSIFLAALTGFKNKIIAIAQPLLYCLSFQLIVVILGCLFGAFLLAVIAFYPKKFAVNPSPDVLLKKYLEKRKESFGKKSGDKEVSEGTICNIARSIVKGYRENQKKIFGKSRLIKVSLILETIGLGLGILLLTLSFIGGYNT